MSATSNRKFNKSIFYILSVHFFILLIFSIYRLFFLASGYHYFENTTDKFQTITKVIANGIMFDNTVAIVLNIIPFSIILLLSLIGIFSKRILQISNIYFIVVYAIAFAICCSDIAYFNYFFRHIDVSILNWLEDGEDVFVMILQNKSYVHYFILYILTVVAFIFYLVFVRKKIDKSSSRSLTRKEYIMPLGVTCLFYIICYFSIFAKENTNFGKRRMLNVSDCYTVTSNLFMNQSVMNGVLNLYKTSQIIPPSSPLNKFIDAETATAFVEKNLGFNYINNEYILENDISNKNLETSANVVLILIESFSKNYLDIKVGNNDLMPFTNNLKDKSFYLNSFYSQATRTNQGILATLYGFPAIFERHMLRNLNIDTYEEFDLLKKDDPNSGSLYTGVPSLKGLPQDLKSRGYNTLFFMNHNPKFDNLNNFLPQNGFNQIYSLDDYPASESVNIWGVSDDYLLNYSLAKLDSASASKQPFFATILTISNHIPYAIDPNFNKVSDNEDENAMAYVDMCIANFMNSAAQKEWYSNTIFVIVGDHGKVLKAKNEYGIPLSLNHIPLIIHSPLFKESKVVEDVAGQIDLYPTIIGLLGSSPIHKSFGIDVINNKRDNIFFPVDDKLVCVNKTHLHIYDTSLKTSSLYEWGDVQFKNIINENKVIADHMKTYSTSMMEAAKYIFNNNLIK